MEASEDCRIPKQLLNGLQYTIFGLGNSLYGPNFNTVNTSARENTCSILCNCIYVDDISRLIFEERSVQFENDRMSRQSH